MPDIVASALFVNWWWTDTVPLLHQQTFPRLLLALFLGICIGAERQWRQRAAGLRTNTLVCLGATAFVDLGLTVAPHTTQVIAYVVSGVGFLGAGTIMKEGVNVRGLNTAATLWCSAAVGDSVAAGESGAAISTAALVIFVNLFLRPIIARIDRRGSMVVVPESETSYSLHVTTTAKREAHLRTLLLHGLREAGLG